MFVEIAQGVRRAPLHHKALNALITPRPLAWLSPVNGAGVATLAPRRYCNAMSADPPSGVVGPNTLPPGEG